MHASSTTPSPVGDRGNGRVRLAIAGLGLLLGSLVVAGPASAQSTDQAERPVAERPAKAERPVEAERPVRAERSDRVTDRREHPAPQTDRRPDRRLEVLQLGCRVAETAAEDTRIHIGCRWREAKHPEVAGYQLWRLVDRGQRELVARGGLDFLGSRDVVSAEAHVVRYAVIAVDERGHRIGQSRVEKLVLRDRDGNRPPVVRMNRHRVR